LSTVAINFRGQKLPFSDRADSVGDRGVVKQIFRNQDYGIRHWKQGKRLFEFHRNRSKRRPSLIIDAGANIGASAVYFLTTDDNAFVFAIEPEINNWNLLEANTAGYPNKENFLGAVARYDFDLVHKGENIFLFNREILTGDTWSTLLPRQARRRIKRHGVFPSPLRSSLSAT
jgi:hypothetical protein